MQAKSFLFIHGTSFFSTYHLSRRALYACLHIQGKGCSRQAYLLQYFQLSCFKILASGICMQCTMSKYQKRSHKNSFGVLKEDVGSDVLQHSTTTVSFQQFYMQAFAIRCLLLLKVTATSPFLGKSFKNKCDLHVICIF